MPCTRPSPGDELRDPRGAGPRLRMVGAGGGAAPRRRRGLGRGRLGGLPAGCSATSTAARSRRRRSRPTSPPRRGAATEIPTSSPWGSPVRGGCGSTPAASPTASPASTRRWCGSIAGECTPIIAGHVYCTAIEGCQEISDFGRVAEWASALERWCSAQPGLLLFTGQCALHRGQLFRVHGDWAQALDELALAAQRYVEAGLAGRHRAHGARVGRRPAPARRPRRGRRCLPAGVRPRLRPPARARPAVARPRAGRCGTRRRRPHCWPRRSAPWRAVASCPPRSRCSSRPGRWTGARSAADELSALACSEVLTAMAAECSGAVELAADDPAGALPFLRKAAPAVGARVRPYDASRTGVLRGRALARLGDDAGSRRELEAARDASAASAPVLRRTSSRRCSRRSRRRRASRPARSRCSASSPPAAPTPRSQRAWC